SKPDEGSALTTYIPGCLKTASYFLDQWSPMMWLTSSPRSYFFWNLKIPTEMFSFTSIARKVGNSGPCYLLHNAICPTPDLNCLRRASGKHGSGSFGRRFKRQALRPASLAYHDSPAAWRFSRPSRRYRYSGP